MKNYFITKWKKLISNISTLIAKMIWLYLLINLWKIRKNTKISEFKNLSKIYSFIKRLRFYININRFNYIINYYNKTLKVNYNKKLFI